jgi:radical SAM-linked protein
MRLFQRAFQRAGFRLKHSQGFNPRPMVSIALPMSVGVESCCELLDFDLEDQSALSHEEICAKLNATLVSGVKVLSVYEPARKVKEISRMRCRVQLEYDNGIDPVGLQAIKDIFNQEQLLVEKKGKNGPTQQDLIPMIRSLEVKQADEHQLQIHALVCCQNPSLNPAQLVAAIQLYLPEYAPDFAKNCRLDLFTAEQKRFR